MNRARILTTVGVFALGLFLCWYGGVDYTQRSSSAALSVCCSIGVAFLSWTCPGWRK